MAHPGVVQMRGTFTDSASKCLVLDYALNRDLSSFLEANRKSPFPRAPSGINAF